MASSPIRDLKNQCELLRSLHRPGAPLLLPNVWDVATARAVVAAGFPVVATTSGGVAATLGYEDEEAAGRSPGRADRTGRSRRTQVPGAGAAQRRAAGMTPTPAGGLATAAAQNGSGGARGGGRTRW